MIIFTENIIQVNKITFQAHFYTFYVNFATFLYINVIIYSQEEKYAKIHRCNYGICE